MSVQGATLFSDPNGDEWMIVAAEGRTFATRATSPAQEISLNGNTLTGDCSFTQAFDTLILWRGTASEPLVLTDFAAGWQTVTQTASDPDAGSGTQPIPNSDGAAFFQNRLLVPFIYTDKKDFVAVGDIGNYTRYAYPQNAFRFNDGSDDEIVDIAPFGRSSVVVFKQKSVRIVDGLTPDSNGNYTGAFQDIVTNTHGLVAPRAWAAVGRDLYYVSTTGVTSLRLTEENKVKGVDLPLSAPLAATWGRIKWSLRDRIRMAYWDSKLYIAVPLDDARYQLSTNLATGTYAFSAGAYRITLTGMQPLGWYYFSPGANDTSAGGFSSTAGGYFQASALGVIVLVGIGAVACTATLNYVPFYEVNNAVLVYDFITQAWAGADATDGVTHVKEWLLPTIDGQRRLVAATEDGLLRLWEEGYEDEIRTAITNPWMDLQVTSSPTLSPSSIKAGGGNTASADSGSATNSGSIWGASTLAIARANLYAGLNALTWGGSGFTATQLDWGARITSTGTSQVDVQINGSAQFGLTNYLRSDCTFGWLTVALYEGYAITTQAVSTSVTTRAYTMQDGSGKRYQSAELTLQTWAPSFSVSVTADGVNELDTVASAQTRSRTTYTIAAAAWTPSNANNDHGNPWRQDYTVTLGSGFNFGTGVNLGLHQTSLERRGLTLRGNACALTLANTSGRCTLKSVDLQAIPGDRTFGTKYTG